MKTFVNRSGLQMSLTNSLTNFIIQQSLEFRRQLRSASSHELSVPRTPSLNLRWLSFSIRRCTDLEQSSVAYYICFVTSCLLLSFGDILLRTLLTVISVVVPQSDTVIYRHVNRSYLLTYLPQI